MYFDVFVQLLGNSYFFEIHSKQNQSINFLLFIDFRIEMMTPSRHDKVALVLAEDGEHYNPVSNLIQFFIYLPQISYIIMKQNLY